MLKTLMMNAPSEVTTEQLKELNIDLKLKSNYFLPFKLIFTSDKSTKFFL